VALDPVFGVKKSLIKQFTWSEDVALAKKFGIDTLERVDENGKKTIGFWVLQHDFVLMRK
jgi:L-ribulose-5-phosphate 3-epimerase UlaE